MVPSQAKNAYRQTVMQTNYHPVELIHMLYERVLVHLEHAEKSMVEEHPISRAEHINKAIAIVTELYVSVRPDESEASQFLIGLYEAILKELPKAGLQKDVEIVRRSHRYLKRLKEVWEETAMQEHGLGPAARVTSTADSQVKAAGAALVKERSLASPSSQVAGSGQMSFSV